MELKAHGVGTATVDAKLKHIGDNQTAVCNVSLAFNRSYKKGDEWQQETAFLRVQLFGARAERMSQQVKKGTPVFVEGHLTQNNWTTKDGETRTAFVLTVRNFEICQRPAKKDDDNNTTTKEAEVPVNASVSDDEIPF